MDKILSGKDGEEKACNYLKSKKYKILEKNYRCLYGEIDIIAKYNNIFTFITSLSIAIIIYYAGLDINKGSMLYAEVLLLIEYSSALKYQLKWFTKHLTNFNESFFAYSKIIDFLNL